MIENAIEQQLNPKYIIDVTKPFHVAWWAAIFGVNEQELIDAVNAVGMQATQVYRYLGEEGARAADWHIPYRSPDRRHADRRRAERRATTRGLSAELTALGVSDGRGG